MANEMRDRLVELFKKIEYTPYLGSPSISNLALQFTDYALYSICDDLIENDVIVPPCKVGDTVYILTSDSPTGIEETRVSEIKIKLKRNSKIQYIIYAHCMYDDWGEAHWTFCIFDFGETVFLTKAEAEQKLKKMRGE